MIEQFESRGGDRVQFHTTHWTLVMASAQSQCENGAAALAELCRIYWYPIYAFARRRGRSPHDAQDLAQGFFMHLLESRSLTKADRLKGKFRSFLLGSFQNYLSNETQKIRSLKRGGSHQFISLDWASAEERYRLEPVDYLTAEKIYDARWAMTLLDHVMTTLRRRYIANGKRSTFEALQAYLRFGDDKAIPSYEEAANTLGIGTPTLKTLVHRLRKEYSTVLREEVGRTVSDSSEIDAEIHSLCEAIIAAEGRIAP